jgi:hypothetical protein
MDGKYPLTNAMKKSRTNALLSLISEFIQMSSLCFRQAISERDKAAETKQASASAWTRCTTGAKIIDKKPRQEKRYRDVTDIDAMGNLVNLVEMTATAGEIFTKNVGIVSEMNVTSFVQGRMSDTCISPLLEPEVLIMRKEFGP